MAEKDFEADDLELKDYGFEPETYTVNNVQITDYTGIEHDKIFLVNKKDVLTKPRPSWIPELDENCLEREDFLPHCVKDSDGYYFVQKTSLDVPEDYNGPKLSDYEKRQKFTKKTYYKMSLDLIAATCDYYIKKRRAEIKLSGDTHRVGFPRSAGSMTWARYDDMVSMFSLCEAYKDDPEITKNYGHIKARRSNPKHKGYIRQTEIAFHDHYGPLLQELKDKKLDMNLQKQDAADTHKKGEETSYGMSGRSDTFKKDYGVTIKKQNGTSFDSQQLKNISEALENVWNHYGKLDDVAIAFNLGISYAANTLQHARKAVGIFHPEYHAIGVSFFEEKVADSKDSSMVLCHEVAHWLDFEKGNRDHFHYASDKSGTLENKIALKFKELVRKRNSGGKKLGDYWYRTCECLARAMEEDYGLKHDCYDFYNDQAYLTPEVFKKEIVPLVEQLLEENRKYFNLVKKENLSKELSTAKDLSFFDVNENALRKLIKSYTSSVALLKETEKSKPDTFNYLRGANKAMDNKINRYQEKIVKLQTKVDVLNMLVQLETKQAFGQFEMKTLETDICPVDRDDILRMDKNSFEYYAAVINSALKNAGFSEKKSIPLVLKNPSGYTFNTLNILEDGNIEVVSGSVNSLSEDEFKSIEEKNLELQKKIFDEVRNQPEKKEEKNIEKESFQQPEQKKVLSSLSSDDSFVSDFRSGRFNSIFDRLSDLNFKDDFISSGSLYSKSRIEGINNLWLELFKDGVPPAVIKFENEWEKKIEDGNFNAPSFREKWIEEASKAENEKLLSYFSKMSVPDEILISEHNGHLFRTMIINAIAKQSRFLTEHTDPFSNIVLYQKPECLLEKKLRYEIIENEIKKRGLKIMQDKEIENNKETSEKTDPETDENEKSIQEEINKFKEILEDEKPSLDRLKIMKTRQEVRIMSETEDNEGSRGRKKIAEEKLKIINDHVKQIENPLFYQNEKTEPVQLDLFEVSENNKEYWITDKNGNRITNSDAKKIIKDNLDLLNRLSEEKTPAANSKMVTASYISDYLLERLNKEDAQEVKNFTESFYDNIRNDYLSSLSDERIAILLGKDSGTSFSFNESEANFFRKNLEKKLIGNDYFIGTLQTVVNDFSKEWSDTLEKENPQLISLLKKACDESVDYESRLYTAYLSYHYKHDPDDVAGYSLETFKDKIVNDKTLMEKYLSAYPEFEKLHNEYIEHNKISKKENLVSIFSNKDLSNRVSKGKKLIDEYLEKYFEAKNVSHNLIDLYAVGDAKRYVSVNYNGSFYKNLSKEQKKQASEFNEKLEQVLKEYASKRLAERKDEPEEAKAVSDLYKWARKNHPFADFTDSVIEEICFGMWEAEDKILLKEHEEQFPDIKYPAYPGTEWVLKVIEKHRYEYKDADFTVLSDTLVKEIEAEKINNQKKIEFLKKELDNKEYPLSETEASDINENIRRFESLTDEDFKNLVLWKQRMLKESEARRNAVFEDMLEKEKRKSTVQEGEMYSYNDLHSSVTVINRKTNRQAEIRPTGTSAKNLMQLCGLKSLSEADNLIKKIQAAGFSILSTDDRIILYNDEKYYDFRENHTSYNFATREFEYDEDKRNLKIWDFRDYIKKGLKITKKMKEFEKIENLGETKMEHKYTFFVKDTAEFEQFADFEPVTNLTAEQAVKKYAELRKDGYSCGIGMHIPGDFIFDDPDGNGITLVVNHEGTAVFDIYGDTFIDQLQEKDIENGRARLYIDLYKELYNAFESEGVSVKKPQFVFDKESELFIENKNLSHKGISFYEWAKKDPEAAEKKARKTKYKANDQKYISKFLDKDGITIDFERWTKNDNPTKILGYNYELSLKFPITKNYLDCFARFVIDETEPDGTFIKNHIDFTAEEYINSISSYYNERNEHYPDQDEFDAIRWKYITDGQKLVRLGFTKIRDIDSDITDSLIKTGRENFKDELGFYKNSSRENCRVFKLDGNAGNPLYIIHNFETQQYGVMQDVNPENPGATYFHAECFPELDGLLLHLGKRTNLSAEEEIQNIISTDNIHLNNEHGENGWHSMDMFVADEKYIKASAISDERFAMPVASWKDGEPEITVSMVSLLISDPENHDKEYLDVSSEGKPSISSDEKWNLIREQKTFDILGEQIKNLSHKGISNEETDKLFEKAKAIFMENSIDVNNFNIDKMSNSYVELFRDNVTGKLITEELNQMGFVKDPDGNYVLDDIKVSLSLVFNNKENPALIISHISAPAVMETIHLNDSYAKKHSLAMSFEDLLESGWLKETKNPNLKSFIDGNMLERDFIGEYIPDADNNKAVTLLDDITAYEEGFSDVLKSFKDFKDAWDIPVSSEQEVFEFGGKLQKALYNAAEAIKDKKAYADSLLRYAEKYKPGMEDPDNVYGKFQFHEDELKVFLKVNMINASIYNISMDKNRDGAQIIFALMSSKDKRHYGYITADFDDPANCKYNFTDLKDHNLDISLTENISRMRDFCEKGKPFYEASEKHSVNIELTPDGSKLSLTFNEVPDIDLRSSLNWAGFKYSTIAKAWKADFNQENSDKLLATVKKYWPEDYEHAAKQMEGIGTKPAAEHKKESISVDFSQIENTSEKLAENIKFINEKYPEYKGNLTHILTDIMFNATSKNRNEILDKFRDCNNKDELNSKLKKMVYGSFETEIKKQQNVKPKKEPEEGFSR